MRSDTCGGKVIDQKKFAKNKEHSKDHLKNRYNETKT